MVSEKEILGGYVCVFFILTVIFAGLWGAADIENKEYKPTNCHVDDAGLDSHRCTCCCCEDEVVTVPCPSPSPSPDEESVVISTMRYINNSLYEDWNLEKIDDLKFKEQIEKLYPRETQKEITPVVEIEQVCTEVQCRCTNVRFTCWSAHWDITVFAQEASYENKCSEKFQSRIDGKVMDSDSNPSSAASEARARRDLNKRPIGTNNTCYFSVKNCRSVRWSVLNSRTMMICFFVFLLMFLLPFLVAFGMWLAYIWSNGGGPLMVFIVITAFLFSFGTAMYDIKNATYGLVLMIFGIIGIVILIIMGLAVLDIFDLFGATKDFAIRAGMLASASGKAIKKRAMAVKNDMEDRLDNYQQDRTIKREFRGLGNQNHLDSKIRASDMNYGEGEKDPEVVVVSYNSTAYNPTRYVHAAPSAPVDPKRQIEGNQY